MICILLLICTLTLAEQSKHTPRWRVEQLEKRTELLSTIDDTESDTPGRTNVAHQSLPKTNPAISVGRGRRLQAAKTPSPETRAEATGSENRAPTTSVTAHLQSQNSDFPHRVRIAAFNLLLAPTPTKLQRVDEDLILVALQELSIKFMKMQFGSEELAANRVGKDTTVEYVLFSDIEGNTWSEGKSGPNDPPRTVLEFNGGVASFVGPNIPTGDEVNEWVETAVNGLFVSTLTETPYSYVELTQYMSEALSSMALQPADILVNVPAPVTHTPKPIQQAVLPNTPPLEGEPGTALFNLLLSLLVAFAFIALLLVLWIRWNNRAVRILCLSGKENEEVVDFTDDDQISIAHNEAPPTTTPKSNRDNRLVATVGEKAVCDLQNQMALSMNPVNNGDENSSSSSISELTVPAMSALSFHSPNPFTKNMASRESFQKEREKNYLSKDMLYSSWAGKAPTIPSTQKRDHRDHSVLQSSYFSAKKEREAMAWMTHDEQQNSPFGSEEAAEFQFEAANEEGAIDGQPDGLYTIPEKILRLSHLPTSQSSAVRVEPTDFV